MATAWQDNRRILVIDDDERLVDAVSMYLRRQGYSLEVAKNGDEGIQRFIQDPPDLVVLDVMMPGIDGWEVCRRIRGMSTTPIIMLTARTNENDRVLGLRLGADDYVPKPFSLKELEARVQAVLRRTHQAPPSTDDVLYADGRLRIERGAMQVAVNGQAIDLTATERRLLFTLVEAQARILAPDQILTQVWGPEYQGQSDYVKLYIWRLRQKIEADPSAPVYIHTERGLGYRFAPRLPAPRPDGADPQV